MARGPIQIRNQDVVRDICELSALTGRPLTDTVADAVREALARTRRTVSLEERRAAVREAVRRFHASPALAPMPTDAELYDQDGLPR